MDKMIPKKEEHIKSISDIKDVFLKTELEMLINNWCVQKSNGDYVFFKHFETSRKGVVYQLVLSGNDYDGLYEMEVLGKKLKLKNAFNKTINDMVLKFETLGNYELASFEKLDKSVFLDRKDYPEFEKTLKTNLMELSKIDALDVTMKNGEKKRFEQTAMGEIKFRTGVNKLISKFTKDIESIHIYRKKKPFYISRLDLGEKSFKEELLKRNFITNEEYQTFTSQNKSIYEQLFNYFKKVEII